LGKWKAKKTLILFHPINNTTTSGKEYLGLKNNQKKIEMSSSISRTGKISPSQEMNHHLMGSR
jgi:hypothetical protein